MKKIVFVLRAVIMPVLAFAIMVSCQDNLTPSSGQTPPAEDNPGDIPPSDEDVVLTPADSLANALTKQIKAAQSILSDDEVSVTSFRMLEDGKCSITLSNRSSFTAYPGGDAVNKMLSFVEDNNEKYWSLADPSGTVSPLNDPSGNKVPLSQDLGVKVDAGFVVLTVADWTVSTAFAETLVTQAFAVLPHKDADGDAYAATITLSDGKTKMLKVDSYEDVYFSTQEDQILESGFVGNGQTASFKLAINDGVDFELVVSEGWTVEQDTDNAKIINVTAPQEDDDTQIPVLKLVVCDEIVLAELPLYTRPFMNLFASSTKAVIEPVDGIGDYTYGLCLKSDFDPSDLPEESSQSNETVSVSLAELYGESLAPGTEYVLWASINNFVESYEFVGFGFDAEVGETSFRDAQLSLSVKGSSAIYGGTLVSESSWKSSVLKDLNASILTSKDVSDQTLTYSGPASEFPAADMNPYLDMLPATKYVTWVVAKASEGYTYTEEDIYFCEFTTTDVTHGGSLEVTFGDVQFTSTSISVPVTCEGAEAIYYAVIHEDDYRTGTPEDQLFKTMKEKGLGSTSGASAMAHGEKLKPGEKYYVFATAVDADGKIGPINNTSAEVADIEKNSIKLSIDAYDLAANSVTCKVTSDGGDLSEYVYWIGTMKDPFWTTMGATKKKAGEYMACYPDDDNIMEAMETYGRLSSDGVIKFDGLRKDTQYIFVVVEKKDGKYSDAEAEYITTLSVDLGNVVREGTYDWASARNKIVIEWNERAFSQGQTGLMSAYGFQFSCPKDMTAYVLCGSEGYFDGNNLTKTEYQIIDMEAYCARSYDDPYTPTENGESRCEPSYVKDGVTKPGQLMNAYRYCVHGVPTRGFVAYFAEGTHEMGNCTCWNNGQCTQYQEALRKRDRHLTMEPYESRATSFGLKGEEAANWAQALYEAYLPYYKDVEPLIFINDGSPLTMFTSDAMGLSEDGTVIDKVIVVLKDLDGNYYEPMFFDVPNYFK